ncbi:MAG: ABC-type phosphate/phosphonate transport system substrate-binding protein [Paracoccaceae bacterium]|jgi:ABC-type phosphate/phosphonate transport system substrate-binding protein
MIASLGMYIRPETMAATDRFWTLIRDGLRAAGINAPDSLSHDQPFWETWQSAEMVFSQTCGRPYRLKLHTDVNLVGTPDYGFEGLKAGYYASPFVVRADDERRDLSEFKDAVFAFNEELSQSGWAAPQTHVATLGFQFQNTWQSGGHIQSAQAVADGRADIASLDLLSWKLIERHEACAAKLRVIGMTKPTPGLPYITGRNVDVGVVGQAVNDAILALSDADRNVLCLKGLVQIPTSDYLAVPNP